MPSAQSLEPILHAIASRTPRRSEIRELLAITANRSVIGFGGGLTAPELFPVEEVVEALQRVLADRPSIALQYGPTEGLAELREVIAARLTARGIACDAGDVLVTTGSQQALDLLAEALLGPGSKVVVERPTYVGALQAFSGRDVEFTSFPIDPDSPPSLVYVVPTFQNPSGITWSRAQREGLLELGLPVVEDDPYSELAYDEDPPPALRALPGGGDVVHLGTFSKVLAPGLRIGYVLAPRPLREHMVLIKQSRDLHTDALAQCLVAEFCRAFDLDAHIGRLRRAYGERRDVMLTALAEHMPAGVSWTRPGGGMFLWVSLPESVDAVDLLPAAVEAGVSFVPGTAFHADADGSGRHALRLNFTSSSVGEIRTGVGILGRLVKERVSS